MNSKALNHLGRTLWQDFRETVTGYTGGWYDDSWYTDSQPYTALEGDITGLMDTCDYCENLAAFLCSGFVPGIPLLPADGAAEQPDNPAFAPAGGCRDQLTAAEKGNRKLNPAAAGSSVMRDYRGNAVEADNGVKGASTIHRQKRTGRPGALPFIPGDTREDFPAAEQLKNFTLPAGADPELVLESRAQEMVDLHSSLYPPGAMFTNLGCTEDDTKRFFPAVPELPGYEKCLQLTEWLSNNRLIPGDAVFPGNNGIQPVQDGDNSFPAPANTEAADFFEPVQEQAGTAGFLPGIQAAYENRQPGFAAFKGPDDFAGLIRPGAGAEIVEQHNGMPGEKAAGQQNKNPHLEPGVQALYGNRQPGFAAFKGLNDFAGLIRSGAGAEIIEQHNGLPCGEAAGQQPGKAAEMPAREPAAAPDADADGFLGLLARELEREYRLLYGRD